MPVEEKALAEVFIWGNEVGLRARETIVRVGYGVSGGWGADTAWSCLSYWVPVPDGADSGRTLHPVLGATEIRMPAHGRASPYLPG